MENNNLPEDFYKSTNFYTLAGTAGAVWLLCIVIGSLDIDNKLQPIFYRIIAVVVSMLISVIMTFRKDIIKAEYWLFAFFNGLLIFVNASGLNAITSNQKFGYSINNEKASIGNQTMSYASFFDFKIKNVSWWQDNDTYIENKILKRQNEDLLVQNQSIRKLNDSISNVINSKNDLLEIPDAGVVNDNASKVDREKLIELNGIIKMNQSKIVDLNNSLLKLNQEITDKNAIIEKLKLQSSKPLSNDCSLKIRKLNLEISELKDKYIQCMDNYNNH